MATITTQSSITTAFVLLLVCLSFAGTKALAPKYDLSEFNRSSFPKGFIFGAASAAYQYEGAAAEGGRGPSIWDFYTHKYPEKILDKSNGDVANDFYHLYKDDVKLMKHMGLNAFRLSISWSRILPHGKLSGGVNKEGIAFYNNVINELLAKGITPYVTIFHWDLPQALEDEYKGFLSPKVVDDFRDFADVCFKEFGDRVKNWITANEPFTFINGGYDGGFLGNLAPGRCSDRSKCPEGDSATEPYIAGHHLLLSHAATVQLYKTKYQKVQKGQIGITIVTHWFVPRTSSRLDVKAAQQALDFVFGWFIHPVVYGYYPKTMQKIVGKRLPKFTVEQAALLKGSYDFIGLNYYTGNYAAHLLKRSGNVSSTSDQTVQLSTDINGVPIGEPTGVSIFFVYPQGLRDLLVYTKAKYNNPKIYITETGMGDFDNVTTVDLQRVDFYNRHLHAVREAIVKNGVNVKGVFPWSFMDNFEWGSGYAQRFGLVFIDRKNGLKRIIKSSGKWFMDSLT